jgi:hypothetical protein
LSVLTQKKYFLCGNGILEDHGTETTDRVRAGEIIFMHKDDKTIAAALRKHNIQYLYVTSNFLFGTNQVRDFLTPVFRNDRMTVLMVEKEKMPK